MRVRELAGGGAVRRPTVDGDELTAEAAEFGDDFEYELALIEDSAHADATGWGTVSESRLVNVDLRQARLKPLTLTDVEFERVELSSAVLEEVTARRVEFMRCRAMGLRIGFTQAADVYAEGCRFDYGSLHVHRSKGPVAFVDCTFREATIGGDLTDATFAGCDFAGAEFRATAAKNCDLTSSRLLGARGLLSLKGATITAEQAIEVADQLAAEAGLRVRRP